MVDAWCCMSYLSLMYITNNNSTTIVLMASSCYNLSCRVCVLVIIIVLHLHPMQCLCTLTYHIDLLTLWTWIMLTFTSHKSLHLISICIHGIFSNLSWAYALASFLIHAFSTFLEDDVPEHRGCGVPRQAPMYLKPYFWILICYYKVLLVHGLNPI